MNNLSSNLGNEWVVPLGVDECKQRISDLSERGFSPLRTITEFTGGDSYNQSFSLHRVSRNFPIKTMAGA